MFLRFPISIPVWIAETAVPERDLALVIAGIILGIIDLTRLILARKKEAQTRTEKNDD